MKRLFVLSSFLVLFFCPLVLNAKEVSNFETIQYTVQKGDSWWLLSKKQLSDLSLETSARSIAVLKNLYSGMHTSGAAIPPDRPLIIGKKINLFAPQAVKDIIAQNEGSGFWKEYIASGEKFSVVFNQTLGKFDDSKFTGDWRTDPMGTLRGNERYLISYSPTSGWTTTGFNQAFGPNYSTTYPDRSFLQQHKMSLWGRVYRFNQYGQVFDPEYGFVGLLSLY